MKKSKATGILVLILAIMVGMTWYAGTIVSTVGVGENRNIKLGLDLAGGVSITYQAVEDNPCIAHSNKSNVRISECLECSSSTLQESEVWESGYYPVYGANGIVGYLDNYNTQSEAIYIIKDGSGVGTVSYVTGKCSATGTLSILQAKEGYSLQYLYYLLKVFNFEPYKTGMAIPHIYFKDYGKAKIFCPSYSEQIRYANLLSIIDDKLSEEQKIRTNFGLQKQYLLRQMFI